MLTFLLSVVVLGALIFAGYRITMYLYSQVAVGTRSRSRRDTDPEGIESFPIPVARRMAKRERNEDLLATRVGLALIIGFIAVLVVLALSILVPMFH